MISNYNMDETLTEISNKELLLDNKVESQVILQLLVAKGIVTREEVADMRNTVKNSHNYKLAYEALDVLKNKAEYYKNNPQEHLKDVLKAKMNGDIK